VTRAVRADRRPWRGRSWPRCGDAERCADGSEAGRASEVSGCRAVTKERARGTQSRERGVEVRTSRSHLRSRYGRLVWGSSLCGVGFGLLICCCFEAVVSCSRASASGFSLEGWQLILVSVGSSMSFDRHLPTPCWALLFSTPKACGLL